MMDWRCVSGYLFFFSVPPLRMWNPVATYVAVRLEIHTGSFPHVFYLVRCDYVRVFLFLSCKLSMKPNSPIFKFPVVPVARSTRSTWYIYIQSYQRQNDKRKGRVSINSSNPKKQKRKKKPPDSSMNNQYLPRIPLKSSRQLPLTHLQFRTNLIKAMRTIKILPKNLIPNNLIFLFPKRRRRPRTPIPIPTPTPTNHRPSPLTTRLPPRNRRDRRVLRHTRDRIGRIGTRSGARRRRRLARCASVFMHAVQEALYHAEGDEATDVDVCQGAAVRCVPLLDALALFQACVELD